MGFHPISAGPVLQEADAGEDAARVRSLVSSGFQWNRVAAELGISSSWLRRWWAKTGSNLVCPVELAMATRLIQANYQISSPVLFDGLMTCSCGRKMVRPYSYNARGKPHRWSCPVCRQPSGKRDWVQAATIKRAAFDALQRRVPEMARLCEHRTPRQRQREQQWLQKLEDFLAMSRQLHEAGLPRMDYPTMAARVQLARDQVGEDVDLVRRNWGRTFSSWGAWEGATSHQWRMVATFFCRKIVMDRQQQLQVVLFGRRFVDPLLMDGHQHLVDQPIRRFPVHPLAFSHPAHRDS